MSTVPAGDGPAGAAGSGPLWRRIVALFRPYRARVGLIVTVIVVSSGLSVVGALLIKVVFDKALFPPGGPNLPLLFGLVAVLVAIPVVTGVLNIVQTYYTNWVGNRVMRDLRDRLFGHLERMSLAFFTGTRTGEVQSRLANDVGGVQTTITETASSVVSNVVVVGVGSRRDADPVADADAAVGRDRARVRRAQQPRRAHPPRGAARDAGLAR